MEHTKIPEPELAIYRILDDIKVVFDVGARADIDFLEIKPKATYHLFEPNPEFFEELKDKVGNRKRVYLNNFGLGDRSGDFHYSSGVQSFLDQTAGILLPVRTINWYIKEKRIKHIDFLKIDTEGWDFNVILGASDIISKTKYIQYEHWGEADNARFHKLLGEDFDICYIGYRNSICMSKRLVPEEKRKQITEFINQNNFANLA